MAEENINQPDQPQEQTQIEQQPVQEEVPPQVIEIRPPPPFEGEGLDSIIEEYAKLRGLDDKRAAAVKLARVMFNMGVNPERYTKNVETYINNMSSLLEAIPDTEETIPVKGALLGKTAVEASRLIRKAHFPEESEDFDLQRDLAAVRRMALTLKMIDKVFGGGNEVGNKEVEMLKRKIESMEEKDKFQQMLNPLQMQIQQIQKQLENLTNKPNTSNVPEPLLAEIRRLNEKISAIETKYGLTKEISDIKQQISALATKPPPMPTTPTPTQPADPTQQLTSFIEKTTNLLNTLKDYSKVYGKESGELDWRSVAISTIGEVGTEAIKAYREVQSKQKTATQTQTQGAVDPIIERRVYNYAMRKIQEGANTLNTVEAAKELGLTPMQVWDALTTIKNKGLLSAQAVKSRVQKKEAQVEDHTGIEEGEIAGVEET